VAKEVYFRIGEAAQMLGVSASCLRNWEHAGLLKPARSQGRYRLYSRESIKQLKQIRFLRRVKRVNPAGIAAMLVTVKASAKNGPASARNNNHRVGEQLARCRRQLGMTLTAVSERTGLSPSFLSSLEQGQANPSVATVQKLAHLYQTNVLSLFGYKDDVRRLVRPSDRKVLAPSRGVHMELLAFGDRLMEPHIFRVAPGAGSGGSYDHQGEEFLYMLDGTIEIWLDEVERYVLTPGDSLYFESALSHRWRNVGKKEATILWVNSPATF
jgi:DNA-binding transcriptional MerR regulator